MTKALPTDRNLHATFVLDTSALLNLTIIHHMAEAVAELDSTTPPLNTFFSSTLEHLRKQGATLVIPNEVLREMTNDGSGARGLRKNADGRVHVNVERLNMKGDYSHLFIAFLKTAKEKGLLNCYGTADEYFSALHAGQLQGNIAIVGNFPELLLNDRKMEPGQVNPTHKNPHGIQFEDHHIHAEKKQDRIEWGDQEILSMAHVLARQSIPYCLISDDKTLKREFRHKTQKSHSMRECFSTRDLLTFLRLDNFYGPTATSNAIFPDLQEMQPKAYQSMGPEITKGREEALHHFLNKAGKAMPLAEKAAAIINTTAAPPTDIPRNTVSEVQPVVKQPEPLATLRGAKWRAMMAEKQAQNAPLQITDGGYTR